MAHCNVSRSHGKRLYTNDLWAAVVAEFGPEEDGKIEERTRRETIDLLRTVIGGLPKLESKGRKSHYLGFTLAPAPAEDAEDWPLCEVCGRNPVVGTKESRICGWECLEKLKSEPLRPISGGVDGEAARKAILHKLVVNTGKDCHAVDNGIIHYGIGPDWTHCYCGKYQKPETAGRTWIDGQPSPEWALHVKVQPPDERQFVMDSMPAPSSPITEGLRIGYSGCNRSHTAAAVRIFETSFVLVSLIAPGAISSNGSNGSSLRR